MEWINLKKEVPGTEQPILVFCKRCGLSHSVCYDFGRWNYIECCSEKKVCFSGAKVEFEYWMPLPRPPNE